MDKNQKKRLDQEFARIVTCDFWVIATRNSIEKVISVGDKQIFLDPVEAKTECDRLVKEFRYSSGIRDARPYRVLKCKVQMVEEV